MKKSTLICLLAAFAFCLPVSLLAQVGTPGSTIQFATPAGELGQSTGPVGLFGDITDPAANWAAIGTAPFPPGAGPYGLRIQRNNQFGVFNLVANGGTEDLIQGWGSSGGKLRFRYVINQFSGIFDEIMTLSNNGNVGVGFTNPLSYEKMRVEETF
ncbi:MAG: hypothetical protein AAF206_27405, partial [Bacteroidota bacterium]